MSLAPKYIHTGDVHNLAAASELVPHLVEILRPASVIDVGCGLGDFLSVFTRFGVSDIKGLDGDWVSPADLFITAEKFEVADLEQSFDLGRRFDLLLCLEVAEHLRPEVAENFVASLVRHADLIVFSAAIPGQGGQNHLNEQPHAFWASLFSKHDFLLYDVIRPFTWENEKVPVWYRQNMFLFVKQGHSLPVQQGWAPVRATELHTYVHPALLQTCRNEISEWKRQATLHAHNYESVMSGRYTWNTYWQILKSKLLGKKS